MPFFFIQIILVSLILMRIFNDKTCRVPVVGVACGGAELQWPQEDETLGFTSLSLHGLCSREGIYNLLRLRFHICTKKGIEQEAF